MKNHLYIYLFSLSLFLFLNNNIQATTIDPPTSNSFNEDSLARLISNFINEIPQFTDEEYEKRMQALSNEIQYKLDPLIKERILARTEKYRTSTEGMLGRGTIYFPIFEEHLAKYNLPHHIKYLSIVESNLNPLAKSPASAVGLWQFIPSSGRLYGLDINSYVDERSDTYLASEAAARMLHELFKKYNDWSMALAAYNCGSGRLDQAARLANSNDYWEVRKYLPKETQKYVPYFMAMVYVGEFHETHDLIPERMSADFILTDTIHFEGPANIFDLANKLEIHPDTFKFLNPSYKKGYIPQKRSGQIIVLPARIVAQLRGYQNALLRVQSMQKDNPIRAVRRVQDESDLSFLAKAYRCTVEDILGWNDLPSHYQVSAGDLIALRKFNLFTSNTNTVPRPITQQNNLSLIPVQSLKTTAIHSTGHIETTKIQQHYSYGMEKSPLYNNAPNETVKAVQRHRIMVNSEVESSYQITETDPIAPIVPKAEQKKLEPAVVSAENQDDERNRKYRLLSGTGSTTIQTDPVHSSYLEVKPEKINHNALSLETKPLYPNQAGNSDILLSQSEFILHRLNEGENFESLQMKYPALELEKFLKLNQIQSTKELVPGMVVKVY